MPEILIPHFCRGCGQALPLGFRGLFHPKCLTLDKQRRTQEKRRHFEELFQRRIRQISCASCGSKIQPETSRGATQDAPVKLHAAPGGKQKPILGQDTTSSETGEICEQTQKCLTQALSTLQIALSLSFDAVQTQKLHGPESTRSEEPKAESSASQTCLEDKR
jgi:hypothetical protein